MVIRILLFGFLFAGLPILCAAGLSSSENFDVQKLNQKFEDSLVESDKVTKNLPMCLKIDDTKKSDQDRIARWNNCFGAYTIEFSSTSKGDILSGVWKNGKLSGFSTYMFANGNLYMGEFKDGHANGFGRWFYHSNDENDGDVYTGYRKNSQRHGIGFHLKKNGEKYIGYWERDFRNGYGIVSFSDGTSKEGFWKDDKIVDDYSKQSIENLSVRKAEQSFPQNPNNLPNCPPINETKKTDHERTKKWHNCVGMYQFKFDRNFGDQYAGEWRKGLPDGDGIYQYSNGDRFEGQMKNGLRDGNGFQSYAKGGYYTGMWKLDKFDDFGIVTYSNDDYYLGFHRRGERHGKGIYYSIDGKQKAGIWQEGRLIKSETVSLEEAFEFSKRNEKLSNVRKSEINKFRQGSSSEKNSHSRIDLKASLSQLDANGAFTISIQTNADTASLKINGEEQGGKLDGNYSIKRVARVGQDTHFTITAVDVYGNSDTKTITVTREAAPAADTSIALKPETIKQAPARDAVAIIIGIQDYKRVPKAEFANNDAKEFYEYAIRALGIKQEKIKMLLDDEADEVNIVKAFENWLPIQVNKDKTDVYVFYSGHGLPAPDGKSLYFLPHGVDKELLSRTAVGQNEIVAALSAAKPKSVTMFIDACYSGQTRGGDVLVANSKPLSLKSDTNAYPPNFTVITASANDQISSSSPELKHGIFSFYLMKGMEGEADTNRDGKITAGEMQDYLSDKVSRQAMTLNRKQTTQLVGDTGRVLITR